MATKQGIIVDVDAFRKRAGISILALSLQTGIARTSLRRKLAQPGLFTLDEFAEVRDALNISDDALQDAS